MKGVGRAAAVMGAALAAWGCLCVCVVVTVTIVRAVVA